jgi:hypothetical protein
MPHEQLEEIGIPVHHPFTRAAVQAWWFIPSKHDQAYFKILNHIWCHPPGPDMLARITEYFHSILPGRDLPQFELHLEEMLASLAPGDRIQIQSDNFKNPDAISLKTI